jgi:hypothetical protein
MTWANIPHLLIRLRDTSDIPPERGEHKRFRVAVEGLPLFLSHPGVRWSIYKERMPLEKLCFDAQPVSRISVGRIVPTSGAHRGDEGNL